MTPEQRDPGEVGAEQSEPLDDGSGEYTPTSMRDPFESMFDEIQLRALFMSDLRYVDFHPDDIITVLRYAVLGLERLMWRNTVLEDWHAGPDSRLHDSDMFRANTDTTRIIHSALWGAFADRLIDPVLVAGSAFDAGDVEVLASAFQQIMEDAFDPDRVLPHGPTLGELARTEEEFDELWRHAMAQTEALEEQADLRGVHVILMFLALKGYASRSHWLAPDWPKKVDVFMAIASDPAHNWWKKEYCSYPSKLPEDVADFDGLRKTLLLSPWLLSAEAAEFCVCTVGIGFVRPDIT